MTHPSTTREALIVEALGEAAKLIRQVEALAPALDESRQALADAHSGLASQLAAFEAQVSALTEKANVVAVKHILARTDEATRRSIDLQGRAMADAARVAFGAELGATMQRLQLALQPLIDRQERGWEQWLTHAAAAATASAVTWTLAVVLWTRLAHSNRGDIAGIGLNPTDAAGIAMRSTQQFSITLPNEMADAVRAKAASGEYATESEVIRDGLRVLLARDRVSEAWLRKDVAATYDALKADPSRAVPVGAVNARLAAARTKAKAKT